MENRQKQMTVELKRCINDPMLIKHILAFPTLGRKFTVSVLQPFTFGDFQ